MKRKNKKKKINRESLQHPVKTFRRFGINFRHEGHYKWLKLAITILGTATAISVYNQTALAISFANLFFFVTAFAALVATGGGAVETKLFSFDCIWFNAMMGLIGFLLEKTLF